MDQRLRSIRYNPGQIELKSWSLIEATGADRESFFQGQVTNDLNSLSVGEAQLTARLNRVGKVQSFFYIAKLKDKLIILTPSVLTESILEDFKKFIIMEDVELKDLDEKVFLQFNCFLVPNDFNALFHLNFYGLNATLTTSPIQEFANVSDEELEEIRFLNGYPRWKKDIDETFFINDSYLNELAISYKKGCFLGQETVAKIENNRGPAYYPVLFKLANGEMLPKQEFLVGEKKAGKIFYQKDTLLQATLFRDLRVEGKKLEIKVDGKYHQATVHYLPYYKGQTPKDLARELFYLGVEEFQKNNIDSAMEFMERAILFDPEYSDPYESIGVILGRKERYEEAISWMDKLLSVKNSSVLAHTNKSLFLMKLGKIEEAEAEKSLATVKSFSMFGEESKQKKALAEEKAKKDADILRREKMFLEVLEMDAEDTIALYGLGDIAFYRGQYEQAEEKLKKVITCDGKYSTAYLLLGKSLEALGKNEEAKIVYQKGIEVASTRGDMMPANEMQSRLNQLVVGTSLI